MDIDAVKREALAMIRDERQRQDEKWGEQNHSAPIWSLVATEELGEVAQASLELRFQPYDNAGVHRATAREHYITELVQLTAVCMAWLECELRREESYVDPIT